MGFSIFTCDVGPCNIARIFYVGVIFLYHHMVSSDYLPTPRLSLTCCGHVVTPTYVVTPTLHQHFMGACVVTPTLPALHQRFGRGRGRGRGKVKQRSTGGWSNWGCGNIGAIVPVQVAVEVVVGLVLLMLLFVVFEFSRSSWITDTTSL